MFRKIRAVIRQMRRHSLEGHLSVPAQIREMLYLWWKNGIGPGYYVKAGLWHRDMKWADKLDYISEPIYWNKMKERNPIAYHMITMNKVVDKALRVLYKIPSSTYLGVYHPLRGRDMDSRPLCTADDMARLIRKAALNKICIKPLDARGGAGFVAIDCRVKDGGVQCKKTDGETWLSVTQFCQETMPGPEEESILLETYLDQHKWYQTVNPSSVNTLRIYVVWYDDKDKPEILGGIFRFGRAGSSVDNTDAGGLFAGIDAATGRLGSLRSKDGFTTPQGSVHPDTGVMIEGEVLPIWENAKSLVLEAMMCIPAMRAIGFDVAITPDGPVILEANERTDYKGLATTGIPPGRFVNAYSQPQG